jgi:DDE superfamily endonuclease
MELTPSLLALLQQFGPVFTAPTFTTFVQIVTGWVFSQRHLFITEIIFSGGHVGAGHWSRFHRFFSHAAWDLDAFALRLAKLVVSILAPGATLLWAVDDTLSRRRGLTLFGAGMHHDALLSSRKKPVVSWGHDWVVLCLLIVHPFWAPTKVFALPVAARLYRNRQGLTRRKKGRAKAPKPKAPKPKAPKPKADPNHRTRPELAVELIKLAAAWFPDDLILVTGDSAYGGKSVLGHLPENVHLISRVHPKGALYEPAPRPEPNAKRKGRPRKKGARLPGMAAWAEDPEQPWTELAFHQFGLHATLAVKTTQALYYKSGGDRLLTIVLVRDLKGGRPDQMFYCTQLDWDARQVLATYAYRWAIECTFENCKQLMGLGEQANRVRKAVERTAPMAFFLYSLVVVWFHQVGHELVRFPLRPWYRRKQEPSFADMLTTLRRVSYDEKTEPLLPERCGLKTWIAQLTELLSRAG